MRPVLSIAPTCRVAAAIATAIAAAVAAADEPLPPSAPRVGEIVRLSGGRQPGVPTTVIAAAEWDDFARFYKARNTFDWDTVDELRESGAVIDLEPNLLARVLEIDLRDAFDPDDHAPDALHVLIVGGPHNGRAYWIPAHATTRRGRIAQPKQGGTPRRLL
jgi:hypothetical protein